MILYHPSSDDGDGDGDVVAAVFALDVATILVVKVPTLLHWRVELPCILPAVGNRRTATRTPRPGVG